MRPPQMARDIMVTELVTLNPELPVANGLARLLRHHVSGAPVIDDQHRYVGVFSEKCGLRALTAAAGIAACQSATEPLLPTAGDLMVTRVIAVSPDMDIVDAIGKLLQHRISGAPIADAQGKYLGVLSERYSMQALLDAVYEQRPASTAAAFMDTDTGRIICEHDSLVDVAQKFLDTHYRRLMIVDSGQLQGLISRRDVLRAGQHLTRLLATSEPTPMQHSARHATQQRDADAAPDPLPGGRVADFMDADARTIATDTDLLTIAQIFLNTNHRRLPVIAGDRLLGQVSRRDVLLATYQLMAAEPDRRGNLLYLSALVERGDAPMSS